MRISILSPNLSNNALGRAYVLAQLLERNHEVEIIGPKLGDEIWAPIKDEYSYKAVESEPQFHRFSFDVTELLSKITGDVVYASKPRLASYGVGLIHKIREERPLVLDIDDWESGLNYGRRGKIIAPLWGVPALIHHNTYYYTRAMEGLAGIADARTVSTQFLKDKFGGRIIPHARDTDYFNPVNFDQESVRTELGISQDEFVVMFSGTPRPHKGVEDLAEAIAEIDDDEVRLILVGAEYSEYVNRVCSIGGDSVIVYGTRPFSEIPKWIASADVVAVPQRVSPETRGQLPAKVIDAMAMGKPIIATNVSDLPSVIGDGGLIVEPESPNELRDAILELASNPHLRSKLGSAARSRCVGSYSYDAIAPELNKTFRNL